MTALPLRLMADVNGHQVQLLICGGVSVAVTVDPDAAERLATDLLKSAHEARLRARKLREVTRPMCRGCIRDCSECRCVKGGVA